MVKIEDLKIGRKVLVNSQVADASCKGFVTKITKDEDDKNNCFIEIQKLSEKKGNIHYLIPNNNKTDIISVNLFEVEKTI